jgi:nicotinamidase/pyrazinamidase
MSKALLVVDVQNDFYPGGTLAVPKADKINSKINSLMEKDEYDKVIGTQDWHPKNHKSFASSHDKEPFSKYESKGIGSVLWPDHCLQQTRGAEFHADIKTVNFDLIIRKGYNPEIDSYSAFQENDGTDLGLASYLKGLNIDDVDIVGLALDVCVKYTAEDAVKNGFETNIILEGSKGIEQNQNKIKEILNEMKKKGINIKE